MKQAIFDKRSPNGRVVVTEDAPVEALPPVTDAERIEALEAAVLELAEVILNG